ncbi:MAG: FliM/FliN family flagellar motor switch protein [Pseudomonadota bacterium]|nr:FliM/FliN family flagellar motor switch protein [Pseudomonadota bacterium]
MSEATLSVLARMAGESKPTTASSSDLGVFAGVVVKAMKSACSALLSTDIEPNVSACCAGALGERLQEKPASGVYYWTNDDAGMPAALFVVDPSFAACMTERLLGGALGAPQAGAEATKLVFDMASALVDVAAPALTEAFAKHSGGASKPSLKGKRGEIQKTKASLDVENLPVCAITLDLKYGDMEAKGAIDIFFAQSFVDRLGASGEAKLPAAKKAGAADWSARLKRNVLGCEIPLAVIIDSFATNIGELSRLAVGQTIDLNSESLGALDVSAMTDAGPVSIAKGRLGAIQSNKAVKLTTGIDPDFLRGL